MSNLYDFMSDSPWLTFFLALLIGSMLKWLFIIPFRHMNIRKHGWPPEHCDADGELRKIEREGR